MADTIEQVVIAQPSVWLGAYSPGALALPPAKPTPDQLYAPRGVCIAGEALIVADSGNHRVLIWHRLPTRDGQPADVVLGQPDFYSEGPAAGGRGAANGLHLPTGVCVAAGRLVVADSWHHRLLIWNTIPNASYQPPDWVFGQDDLLAVAENRGSEVQPTSFYWPYGVRFLDGWLYVADTGNRRVLGWEGLPNPGQAPDLILGQPNGYERQENRGGVVGANTFRWPHDIAGDRHCLYVADAGNHRVLGWAARPVADRPADLVIGQQAFDQAREQPHVVQGPHKLRFPYGISLHGQRLIVADTANNRALCWNPAPRQGTFAPADAVLGQESFAGGGENRWKAVMPDTLCWPYGIDSNEHSLAIADSGNNRVMIWEFCTPLERN
ncbi:MAG: NHL repeat-containing protein [Roseiflexaceae bacterium]